MEIASETEGLRQNKSFSTSEKVPVGIRGGNTGYAPPPMTVQCGLARRQSGTFCLPTGSAAVGRGKENLLLSGQRKNLGIGDEMLSSQLIQVSVGNDNCENITDSHNVRDQGQPEVTRAKGNRVCCYLG